MVGAHGLKPKTRIRNLNLNPLSAGHYHSERIKIMITVMNGRASRESGVRREGENRGRGARKNEAFQGRNGPIPVENMAIARSFEAFSVGNVAFPVGSKAF